MKAPDPPWRARGACTYRAAASRPPAARLWFRPVPRRRFRDVRDLRRIAAFPERDLFGRQRLVEGGIDVPAGVHRTEIPGLLRRLLDGPKLCDRHVAIADDDPFAAGDGV